MISNFPDAPQAAEACARHIMELLDMAIAQRGQASLAISGGSSPKLMFQIFAKSKFPMDHVQLFWVDERYVPHTDSQSNFKLANDHWLAAAGYPAKNLHPVDTSLPEKEAAAAYAEDLKKFLPLDVIHLGMGPDCHTASLFPGEPMIDDRAGVAAALWVEKMKQWRITMLPGVLIGARNRVMLITGSDKAAAYDAAMNAPLDPHQYPAQLVARSADLFVSI